MIVHRPAEMVAGQRARLRDRSQEPLQRIDRVHRLVGKAAVAGELRVGHPAVEVEPVGQSAIVGEPHARFDHAAERLLLHRLDLFLGDDIL